MNFCTDRGDAIISSDALNTGKKQLFLISLTEFKSLRVSRNRFSDKSDRIYVTDSIKKRRWP